MVRSCQAEDAIAEYFEGLVRSRHDAEIGLLVGKEAVGSRDLLLGIVSSPSNDMVTPFAHSGGGGTASAAPAKAKKSAAQASASGVSVEVDEEWIAEHAYQIARMLPGGLSILGLYVFCPDYVYQACVGQLCSVLKALAGIASPTAESEGKASSSGRELLLLHVDSASKKQTLRSCAAINPSSLKPGEIKYGPTLSSIVAVHATHAVSMALRVPDKTKHLKQALETSVAAEVARIRAAVGVCGSALPADDMLVMDAWPAAVSASKDMPSCSLQLCCPLPCQELNSPSSASTSVSSSKALVTLSGSVHGVAFVHKRESFAKAVSDIKADLQASLRARMEVFVDDAQRWQEEQQVGAAEAAAASAGPLGRGDAAARGGKGEDLSSPLRHPFLREGLLDKAASFSLPRRVMLPWKGGLRLVDYLVEGEGAEAAAQRTHELVGLDVETHQVAEMEPAALIKTKLQAWHPNTQDGTPGAHSTQAGGKASGGSSSSNSNSMCVIAVAGSAALAAVAAALGYMTL